MIFQLFSFLFLFYCETSSLSVRNKRADVISGGKNIFLSSKQNSFSQIWKYYVITL